MLTKKAILFYLLLLGYLPLSAQSLVITGKIIDREEIPIDYATVVLMNRADSAYCAGMLSGADGNFRFEKVAPGEYRIDISYLGYNKHTVHVPVSGQNVQLSPIVLEEDAQTISAVTVVGRQNQREMEAGKISYNIDTSIAGSSGSALDALKSLPGILVREDGSIYLYGQSGVTVMLDGKPTYLSGENLISLLQSFPSSSVGKIELISHPSAREDAAGNSGLIDIRTKKVRIQGVTVGINSNYQQGRYAKINEGINLSFRRNKVNLYAAYSFYRGKDFVEVISPRSYLDPVTLEETGVEMDMTADRRYHHTSHFVQGGIDYDISEKWSLGAYVRRSWYTRTKDEVTVSDFPGTSGQIDSMLTTHSDTRQRRVNTTGGISFLYAFRENSKWESSLDYQRFDHHEALGQQSEATVFDQPLPVRDTLGGDLDGDIKIYAAQTNLSFLLWGKITAEAGAKTTFVSIDNDAAYRDFYDNTWHDNLRLSNRFSYDENIHAGHLQLKGNISPRIVFEAGLRLENTRIEGRLADFQAAKDSVFKDSYTHLFPTAALQLTVSENSRFALMYGRRIVRPNYRDLNPFVEVSDRYTHDRGNTELQPELADNIEFSYFLKRKYNISLLYSLRQDPITKSYVAQGERLIWVIPMNLDRNHLFGIRVNLSNVNLCPWWTVNLNATLTYKQFHWKMDSKKYTNERHTPAVYITNQFTLPADWSAEITGFYNGRMAEGQAQVDPLGSVSAGIRKSLFDRRITFRLYVNDIFNTNREKFSIQGTPIQGWYSEKRDNRHVGINLRYNFHSGGTTKNFRSDDRINESKRINL